MTVQNYINTFRKIQKQDEYDRAIDLYYNTNKLSECQNNSVMSNLDTNTLLTNCHHLTPD